MESFDENIFQVNIEDIFEVVDSKSELLIQLCHFCCQLDKAANVTAIWRRLLEIELKLWRSKEKQDHEILEVLKMSRMEPKTALVLCRQFDFKPGLIFLLKEQSDRQADLLTVYIESGMHEEAVSLCQSSNTSELWQKALSAWSLRASEKKIVDVLEKSVPLASKVLSISTIVALFRESSAPLRLVKGLVLEKIESDQTEIEKARKKIAKFSSQMAASKEKTSKLLNQATVFKLSKCKFCSRDLTLPSVHFLCGCSFHKHCFSAGFKIQLSEKVLDLLSPSLI